MLVGHSVPTTEENWATLMGPTSAEQSAKSIHLDVSKAIMHHRIFSSCECDRHRQTNDKKKTSGLPAM